LPGEAKGNASGGFPVPAEEQTPTGARKKRGRKVKAKKPERVRKLKVERKKRGPRKVRPVATLDEVRAGTAPPLQVGDTVSVSKTRKKRKVKVDPPELTFIQLLMHLSDKQRRRVVDVLNKIFPA
jgi:hypothetical protein